MAHFFIRPHYQYDPKWCAWFEDSLIDQSASISFPFSLFHCDVTDYSGGLMSLCTVHFYIYPRENRRCQIHKYFVLPESTNTFIFHLSNDPLSEYSQSRLSIYRPIYHLIFKLSAS